MALARVDPPALLTDRVFNTLQAAITSGELPAGTPLRVRDLAEQVGTSVMPVREAIRRLEESGLAAREPHKGAVVRTLSRDELRQTYDVRIVLESEAARLGALAAGPADCAAMRRAAAALVRADERGRVLEALAHDEVILTTLYGAGGNPVLLELIRGLWRRCQPYMIRGIQRAHELGDPTVWSHDDVLITAAERADGATAAAVTREALESSRRRIEQTLDAATP